MSEEQKKPEVPGLIDWSNVFHRLLHLSPPVLPEQARRMTLGEVMALLGGTVTVGGLQWDLKPKNPEASGPIKVGSAEYFRSGEATAIQAAIEGIRQHGETMDIVGYAKSPAPKDEQKQEWQVWIDGKTANADPNVPDTLLAFQELARHSVAAQSVRVLTNPDGSVAMVSLKDVANVVTSLIPTPDNPDGEPAYTSNTIFPTVRKNDPSFAAQVEEWVAESLERQANLVPWDVFLDDPKKPAASISLDPDRNPKDAVISLHDANGQWVKTKVYFVDPAKRKAWCKRIAPEARPGGEGR